MLPSFFPYSEKTFDYPYPNPDRYRAAKQVLAVKAAQEPHRIPVLYSLNPAICGPFSSMQPHIDRLAQLGVTRVHFLPYGEKSACQSSSGKSGSLYAQKNPFRFSDHVTLGEIPVNRVEKRQSHAASGYFDMIDRLNRNGMGLMADIVCLHVPYDHHEFFMDHRQPKPEYDWLFRKDNQGHIYAHQVVHDDGTPEIWDDVAQFNLDDPNVVAFLTPYFCDLARHMVAAGADGLRFDAAHKLPENMLYDITQAGADEYIKQGGDPQQFEVIYESLGGDSRVFADVLGNVKQRLTAAGHDIPLMVYADFHYFHSQSVFSDDPKRHHPLSWFNTQMEHYTSRGILAVPYTQTHDTSSFHQERAHHLENQESLVYNTAAGTIERVEQHHIIITRDESLYLQYHQKQRFTLAASLGSIMLLQGNEFGSPVRWSVVEGDKYPFTDAATWQNIVEHQDIFGNFIDEFREITDTMNRLGVGRPDYDRHLVFLEQSRMLAAILSPKAGTDAPAMVFLGDGTYDTRNQGTIWQDGQLVTDPARIAMAAHELGLGDGLQQHKLCGNLVTVLTEDNLTEPSLEATFYKHQLQLAHQVG